ncbi:NADP-dependent alcohol dehydrogenase [Metarhizium album ARSEF 1941]|uniref:NADP-dependent alcohol dehydrogenase n=1 Tax=Metarhizium album (strain ARSEF 1941) TaxID=1081103 RepID=A0A0B2WN03_METAS|nr:NADP-dependent alcohol dehydrogenase [Metarhizium album ARSEF 1941]KHN95288.1 NADP-dependent alcohol dehydrogenase [Metarhizium album ARSEF 1941]
MGVCFTVFKGSKTGEIVEATGRRDPGPTEVIVKISHCGLCGTDEHFFHNDQGLGHEGIGVITELGSAADVVSNFKLGDRVGMGWFYKFCGTCKYCLNGFSNTCVSPQCYGSHNQDQGCFGSFVAWDVSALFKIPDAIASEDAGPLMCGGATVFSALHTSGVRPGDRVGIVGVGGLGHLAIQFASKMGMDAVVFSSTTSKKETALNFGASEFYTAADLAEPGNVEKVDILLITSSVMPDLSTYYPVLAPRAQIYPLTASAEPINVTSLNLIMAGFRIVGSGVASAGTMQAMLAFAAKKGIKPQIEKFPLTKDGLVEAMARLREGKMRYRGVLVAPQ